MLVLIIYDSEVRNEVENLRNRIAEKFGGSTILRMNYHNRGEKQKIKIKHYWHWDARHMIKKADIIVYAVSRNSSRNKNVEWEIRKALKYNKYIVCFPLEEGGEINDSLFMVNPNTKERMCIADRISNEEELFRIIEDYNSDSYIRLFNNIDDSNILLEQYKIFSDSAENLVNRRQNMNSFYISANTALITVGATVFALSDENNLISKMMIAIALSMPGILINVSWKRTLTSYFINNRGKMKILSMIEKRLAASLYDAEWKAMKNKFSKEKYISFTDSEKRLPLIFILFYIGVDIAAFAVLFKLHAF